MTLYQGAAWQTVTTFMGLDGTSTMHANASSSDATLFSGPGTTDLEFHHNLELNATMPSVLMSENGALVCVGVGTTISTAQPPIVMLISPKTLEQLDQVKLIKPQTGNLAGGNRGRERLTPCLAGRQRLCGSCRQPSPKRHLLGSQPLIDQNVAADTHRRYPSGQRCRGRHAPGDYLKPPCIGCPVFF